VATRRTFYVVFLLMAAWANLSAEAIYVDAQSFMNPRATPSITSINLKEKLVGINDQEYSLIDCSNSDAKCILAFGHTVAPNLKLQHWKRHHIAPGVEFYVTEKFRRTLMGVSLDGPVVVVDSTRKYKRKYLTYLNYDDQRGLVVIVIDTNRSRQVHLLASECGLFAPSTCKAKSIFQWDTAPEALMRDLAKDPKRLRSPD
jgi:hypothetical protein